MFCNQLDDGQQSIENDILNEHCNVKFDLKNVLADFFNDHSILNNVNQFIARLENREIN